MGENRRRRLYGERSVKRANCIWHHRKRKMRFVKRRGFHRPNGPTDQPTRDIRSDERWIARVVRGPTMTRQQQHTTGQRRHGDDSTRVRDESTTQQPLRKAPSATAFPPASGVGVGYPVHISAGAMAGAIMAVVLWSDVLGGW